MTRPAHTQSLLTVNPIQPNQIATIDGSMEIAMATVLRPAAITIENARRLVACWNACDGMSDEQVSHGLVSASVHSSTANQRDELLEALEELKEAVEYTPLGIRGIKGVEKAYAAISKAKATRGDT